MTDEVSVRCIDLAVWMSNHCPDCTLQDIREVIQDWVSKMRTDDPVAGVLASAGLIADLDVSDTDIYVGVVDRMIGIWKAKSETAPSLTLPTTQYPFVPDDEDQTVTTGDMLVMLDLFMHKLDDIAAKLDRVM